MSPCDEYWKVVQYKNTWNGRDKSCERLQQRAERFGVCERWSQEHSKGSEVSCQVNAQVPTLDALDYPPCSTPLPPRSRDLVLFRKLYLGV